MSAIEQIKKLIEKDVHDYGMVMNDLNMPIDIGIPSNKSKFDMLARDASFLSGRISGLSLALIAIEGEK